MVCNPMLTSVVVSGMEYTTVLACDRLAMCAIFLVAGRVVKIVPVTGNSTCYHPYNFANHKKNFQTYFPQTEHQGNIHILASCSHH